MASSRLKRLLVAILVFSTGIAYALSAAQAELLHRDYQLYQSWSLSQDYHFGLTRGSDQIKAYAWLLVYLSILPESYPGKDRLKASYLKRLTSQDQTKAEILAGEYRTRHHLLQTLNEDQLREIAALKDKNEVNVNKSHPTGVIGRVVPWNGSKFGHLVLRHKLTSLDSPDYQAIPLTVTMNGSFYTVDLAPGDYELFIGSGKYKTLKTFHLRRGEIRGLSLIELPH